ncbi:hypothetical protein QQF64_034840 [Cirrhinus molitorella]|uniref:Uncharacterized protein n=1 Tax=Cirrhinus molitorella TaxID=172907 RepID=A0ABR3L1R0_9TELE
MMDVCFSLDEASVKIGKELKLDVLMTHANKVVHQNKISTEWIVVWKRGGGVSSGGNLTINALTVNDAGIYRVLDFDNEILITVTVTESGTDSKGNRTDDDKTEDSELFRSRTLYDPASLGCKLINDQVSISDGHSFALNSSVLLQSSFHPVLLLL